MTVVDPILSSGVYVAFALILGGLAAGYATRRMGRLRPADAIRRGG